MLRCPRDIEATVAEIENVHLHCIDDLKAIIEKNRKGREHAADKAYEMIQARSLEFIENLHSHDKVTNAIRAYRGQIEDICRTELMKAQQQLQHGTESCRSAGNVCQCLYQKIIACT